MRQHRRARPLLGTLVEIRAGGIGQAAFDAAAEAAFEVVAQVHRLMSFHEPGSDIRRIARATAGQRLRVHPRTASVLRQAQRWAQASDGAFDAGCARGAVAAGWLPRPECCAMSGEAADGAFSADALVVDVDEVWVRHPLWLDLGGIAKGYAVDRAVGMLRRHGLAQGVVNAGGDLRVFGDREETVHVRSPFDPATAWPVAAIRDSACATSASGQVVGRPQAGGDAAPRSVTVFARTACAADALTKVVWLRGEAARPLLRRARARAWVVRADGSLWRA